LRGNVWWKKSTAGEIWYIWINEDLLKLRWMKVEFTNHAKDKFLILERHNFRIEKETVIKTVEEIENLKSGKNGRLIAGRAIDEDHLLRVVYEIKDDRLIINSYVLPSEE